MSPSRKLQVMYFLDSYFLSYGEFKMREIKLRVKILWPASGRSPAASVEPCHWSEGYVGVSLQERRDPMQVMLGMSRRARWDATLVISIDNHIYECFDEIIFRELTHFAVAFTHCQQCIHYEFFNVRAFSQVR